MNLGHDPAGIASDDDSRPRLHRLTRLRRSAGPRQRAQLIAVDLGTARTRVSLSAAQVVLDEPTVLGCDRSGRPIAAGWAAWQMAADGRVSLRHPVRAGVVVDPSGCADVLRLLLAEAGIVPITGVAIGIPAVATRRDVLTFASVLAAAAHAPVVSMRPALAAALAAEPVDDRRHVSPTMRFVCDVGTGITQIGAIWEGRLHAQTGVRLGLQDYLDRPEQFLAAVRELMNQVLAQTPKADDACKTGSVRLIGGGALVPQLAYAIASQCDLRVEAADDAGTAVASGLSRLLHHPALAG